MVSINATSNSTYPPWLPAGFQVSSDEPNCPSARRVLISFMTYNCIAIGSFLLMGHSHALALLTRNSKKRLKPWSFWSAFASLALQILGNVLTSLLIRARGHGADIWQLMQLWALRPRVTWILGNMVNINRKWGYANGALNQIFVEVFICGLATVFLGRTLQAAWNHPDYEGVPWWKMMVSACTIMMISTGMEMVWALWMVKRAIEQRGKPEAQDMDSMKWIAAFFVPVTAICSWLVWVAFLKAAAGSYCPGNTKWVDLVWGVVPVLANIARLLIEAYVV